MISGSYDFNAALKMSYNAHNIVQHAWDMNDKVLEVQNNFSRMCSVLFSLPNEYISLSSIESQRMLGVI